MAGGRGSESKRKSCRGGTGGKGRAVGNGKKTKRVSTGDTPDSTSDSEVEGEVEDEPMGSQLLRQVGVLTGGEDTEAESDSREDPDQESVASSKQGSRTGTHISFAATNTAVVTKNVQNERQNESRTATDALAMHEESEGTKVGSDSCRVLAASYTSNSVYCLVKFVEADTEEMVKSALCTLMTLEREHFNHEVWPLVVGTVTKTLRTKRATAIAGITAELIGESR